MESVVKSPVMLYTEQTPNPESLKFVTNKMLYRGTADFREAELANEWSPMAAELFKKDYVNGVYICNNFVTITKNPELDWSQIMLEAKEWIKKYVESGDTIVKEGFAEVMEEILAKEEQERYSGDDAEIVKKIKDLIDTYVKPAVESDGGNIEFKSY
ncbi:MAG TPA: NifU N-terminal domain-containing protein, partial [Saprospiraceae bacterium]|nr:NifU N-terminal domain-containing protein [Saprospiraceae bacterium]